MDSATPTTPLAADLAHGFNPDDETIRTGFLGASDAGVVLGLNPYKTPLRLWLEKTGRLPAPDLSDNDAIHWGKRLEDVIAREYADRYGHKVQRVNKVQVHPDHGFIRAHLDRRVVKQRRALEIKTAGQWMVKEWGEPETDDVPASYIAQCQQQMLLTGYPRADLAVLIGGREFRRYILHADPVFQQLMVDSLVHFWTYHVQGDRAPGPVSAADMELLYPVDSEDAQAVFGDTVERVNQLRDLKARLKALQDAHDTLADRVKREFGPFGTLTFDGLAVATYKAQKRNGIDMKRLKAEFPEAAKACATSTEFRVLRLKKRE